MALALLAACQAATTAPSPVTQAGAEQSAKPSLSLIPASWADLPGWNDDHIAAAIPALLRSCQAFSSKPPTTSLGVAGTIADWEQPCAEARRLRLGDDQAARAFFLRHFDPLIASNRGAREGLFTGYYEALLNGRLSPGARFATPLYRHPPDLVAVDLGQFRPALKGQKIAGRVVAGRLVPYADRTAIERGALAGRGLELVYVDSAADAFFLAVQGSGRVRLPDGRMMRVGYDGENGWPYVSIGHVLKQRGVPADQINLPFLRRWLQQHPGEAAALMEANPSYIFFKATPGEGPRGSQGVVLTPERSAAVDRSFVPLGVPLWIDTSDPVLPGGRLQRLLVAQDTGGAIAGPVRADIFFGFGPAAEQHAGLMKGQGRWWLLLPKAVAARLGGEPAPQS